MSTLPTSKHWFGKLAMTSGMTWSLTSSQMAFLQAFTPSFTTSMIHTLTTNGGNVSLIDKKNTSTSKHKKRHSNETLGAQRKSTMLHQNRGIQTRWIQCLEEPG